MRVFWMLLGLFTSVICTAQHAKINPTLWHTLQLGKADIIVLMKEQAPLAAAQKLKTKSEKGEYTFRALRETAARTQEPILAILKAKSAFTNSLHIVNAISVEGCDAALALQLAARPEVKEILSDPWVYFPPAAGTPSLAATSTVQDRGIIEWNIEKINAPAVWDLGFKGQGVTVGGADTGVDPFHPTIVGQYRGSVNGTTFDNNYNWYDAVHDASPLNSDTINPCGYSVKYPCQDNPHGTHTIGTMVGDDGADNQIGVAPLAKWVACRNMERGWGKPSTYAGCFEWFLAPTDTLGTNADPDKSPLVINNSWYCAQQEGCDQPGTHELLRLAIVALRAAGIVVVVSVGNSGSSCGSASEPPAYFAESFSVGATDIADNIAGFSSRGGVQTDSSNRVKPNVSAPGVQVRSCTPQGGYGSWNGTSMAGPHVAGLVALMLSANPALAGQVDTIERMIEMSALPLFDTIACHGVEGSAHPNNTFGHGRINALAAVQLALAYQETTSAQAGTGIGVELTVFPNPATERIYFKGLPVAEQGLLQIFSSDGRLAGESLIEPNNQVFHGVEVRHLPAGTYFFRIETAGQVYFGRFVR